MQRIAPAHVDSAAFEFSFAEPDKLPRPLLAIDEQSVGYGATALLTHISLTLAPGDRLALLGRNGAGKSTCMKLLAGELTAQSGTRTEARDLKIGYFAQHHLKQLQSADSPLQNLRRIGGVRAARETEQELRDFLASFGFRGDRVFEPVAPFSGGEKARLMLALVTYLRPNLLLLDEPTNHLDLEMRQALAVALQDYGGAVVLVSHDRHLLNTVADAFLVVHHGRIEPFDGDLEDYAAWLAGDASRVLDGAPAVSNGAPPSAAAPTASALQRKQQKHQEAVRRNALTPLRAAVERSERALERLAEARAELERQLADPALYEPSAKARLQELLATRRTLAQQVAAAETAWLEASEQLERACGAI
jgi:ATP-binding cassette subfamily F protein 3